MKENEKIGKFVVKYREKTLAYLRKKYTSLSIEDTEDIYQEASIVLLHKEGAGMLKTLTCELYTYFMRICINMALKMMSVRKRMMLVSVSDGQNVSVLQMMEMKLQSDQHSWVDEEERGRRAEQILSELSEQSRQLMRSYYIEGKSWAEIARIQGLAGANSAKSLACRCRRMLKKKYGVAN